MSLRHLPALLLAASACTPPDVVADVAGRRITIADVQHALRARSLKDVDAAIEVLVTQERLAAEAARAKLTKRPAVQARLKNAEREILAQALLDEATAVDDRMLRDAYEASPPVSRSIRVAHIFFSLPPGADERTVEQVRSRATTAYARLLGGEDFAAVARSVSEDVSTRERGGEIGDVQENSVSAEIFRSLASLAEGAFTAPVETSYGFHVFKALEAMKTSTIPFEQAQGRLAVEVRERMKATLMKRLEEELPVTMYDKAVVAAKQEVRR